MKKLTLYYGRNGHNVLPKLAHYLQQEVQEGHVTLMALPENTLQVKHLLARNTLWFNPVGSNIKALIAQLCMVINAANPTQVEIHADLHESKDSVLMMLKQLWPHFGPSRLRLCLYDDSIRGIDERFKMAHLPCDTLTQAEHLYDNVLRNSLSRAQPLVTRENWNPILNYLWHTVCQVSYHLTDENLLRHYNVPLFNGLLMHVCASTPLTAEQKYALDELATPLTFANTPSLMPYPLGSARFIKINASMGDMIFALAAIKARWQKTPQRNVMIIAKAYHSLALACPYVDDVWDLNDITAAQYVQICYAHLQQAFHQWGEWEHFINPAPMIDAFIGESSTSLSAEDKTVELVSSDSDRRRVDAFFAQHQLCGERVVLLHPNVGAPNRTWPAAQWTEITRLLLADGWRVVLIGSSQNKYAYTQMIHIANPRVINAIDQFSVLETLHLMNRCTLLVATDSGPIALAAATDIAICGLYSIVPGERRLPYRHGQKGWNALAINLGCEHSPCADLMLDTAFYHDVLQRDFVRPKAASFASWCPNAEQYACLKHYSAADLLAEIRRFVESDAFSAGGSRRDWTI